MYRSHACLLMHFPWIQFDGTLKMYRSLISRCALNIGRRAACRLQFQSGFDYSGCTKECSISWNLLDFWTVLKWHLLFEICPPLPLVTVPLTQLISTDVSIFEGTLSLPSPSQGIKVWNMTPRKRSNIVGRAGYPMKQMAPPWLSKFVKK